MVAGYPGAAALVIRKDVPTALADADGDRTVGTVDSLNRLHVAPHTVILSGTDDIGYVSGRSVYFTPAITVVTTGHAIGDVVGGELTLTNAAYRVDGQVIWQNLYVKLDDAETPDLTVYLFSQNPNGPYTDDIAFSWNAVDFDTYLLWEVRVPPTAYRTRGGKVTAVIEVGSPVLQASGAQQNLYAVVVTDSAITFAAAGDMMLRFGFLQN